MLSEFAQDANLLLSRGRGIDGASAPARVRAYGGAE
jgi:hypothetical protein